MSVKTDNQIKLSDGRPVGYAEYGDPMGKPVLHFHGFTFVGEGRITGDDKETRDLGEIAGQHFGEAIAEVFLLRVFAHVDKRQNHK